MQVSQTLGCVRDLGIISFSGPSKIWAKCSHQCEASVVVRFRALEISPNVSVLHVRRYKPGDGTVNVKVVSYEEENIRMIQVGPNLEFSGKFLCRLG